ncbi:MarR family winged helix-turn-helix transcriptional regulator [Microvirga guangxiensis]|uniref:DNA-binding transcriptional regulator, MarR family n=1 Tax=Microvirga guangxiensis TaxID=549386 RepID=A0A1G5L9P8_9HYPH|nr:MarR family transcriptional regulator [Microvirga guangxiensis]SCZ09058.1 DNA-binding transcriptional regulator, MarR family [Microvirga guangxiensis]
MRTVPDAIPAFKRQSLDKDILIETPAYDLIELFFFAYRDFVSDPDRILDEYGFGRAHHRVLHFVSRQPGLTIAELLDILRITKQSLNRVLKELIEKDFIESRMGTADRRQRLLHATPQGRDLALKLAKLQTRRIMRALADAEPEAKEAISRYLLCLIDSDDRTHVQQLVFGPDKT